MPFVPVPDTVEAEIRMTLDGQKIENTLYFYAAAGPDIANVSQLASDLEGWWTLNCAPLLPLDVALREIVITDLSSNTGLQYTSALADPVFGTLGQPALPNNVSLAVSFRSAIRGRSYRGRNYVAALTEGQVVNSHVTEDVAAAWATAYNAIITDVLAFPSPYVWVVVSRFSGVDADGKPVPRSVGNAEPIVSALVTDTTVDSMRRRLPGRGQ
jgi:hypothetical protein